MKICPKSLYYFYEVNSILNTKTKVETASNAPIPTEQLHTLRDPNTVQNFLLSSQTF